MKPKNYDFDYAKHKDAILSILIELDKEKNLDPDKYRKIVSKHIKGYDGVFSKQMLIKGYEELQKEGCANLPPTSFLTKIKMKPTRTQSGVTPVTVLTKPFPCPGKCIFCPNDIRMPKSYMTDEPGAQRATRNKFDPYLQTYDRLRAFKNIGHSTSKIELIILGGTWSFYPESYQIWYIKRCFEAMNDFGRCHSEQSEESLEKCKKDPSDKAQDDAGYRGLDESKANEINLIDKTIRNNSTSFSPLQGEMSTKLTEGSDATNKEILKQVQNDKTTTNLSYNELITQINKELNQVNKNVEKSEWQELFDQHKINETSDCRCVGLVIETRPDNLTEEEVIRIRKLGCTKVQMGVQSLNDEVLEKNKRGHDVAQVAKAFSLLRKAGFKIHAHWMANLYGSTPEQDIEDYKKLFEDERFRPDELKIYPCSLIESAELMDYYNAGKWQPYTEPELLKVVAEAIKNTPEYCRLTRVIRDIPSTDIVVGNKKTNFRQIVELELDKQGVTRNDIRSREIKREKVKEEDLKLKITEYQTSTSTEFFLQYVTKEENKICGFLRLSFPLFSPDKGSVNEVDEGFVFSPSPQSKKSTVLPRLLGEGRGEVKTGRSGWCPKYTYFKNITNDPKAKQFAKELRKDQTYTENLLWYYLRNRRMDEYKFRRQHPIDKYIVDFYCHQLKLIIEIDGEIHEGKEVYDSKRQEYLESLGFTFLRIKREDMDKDLSKVLWQISDVCGKLNNQKPHPSNLPLTSPQPSPKMRGSRVGFIPELKNCAIIREIHVYGIAVDVGKSEKGKAQHLGLGKKLIKKVEEISSKNGYKKLAVISAIGTKEYYKKRGFENGDLYQIKRI